MIKNTSRQFVFEFIKFAIVGVIATIISYSTYVVLEQVGLQYNVAYTLGYLISFCFNYVASTYFTFKTKATAQKGAKFTFAHIFNYCLQMVLLNLFISIGIEKVIAPVFVYAISIPTNFLVVRIALKDK